MNRKRSTARWLKRILNLALALMFLLGAFAVVSCATALVRSSQGRPVGEPVPVDVIVACDLAPDRLAVDMPGADDTELTLIRNEGTLRARTGRPAYLIVYFLLLLMVLAVVIVELQLFRRILDTVIRGEPFARVNVGRIRWIGLIVIGWSVLAPVAKYLWASWVLRLVETHGGRLRPPVDLDPETLWVGFGILVLAEVFRQGTLLEEERSLTI